MKLLSEALVSLEYRDQLRKDPGERHPSFAFLVGLRLPGRGWNRSAAICSPRLFARAPAPFGCEFIELLVWL